MQVTRHDLESQVAPKSACVSLPVFSTGLRRHYRPRNSKVQSTGRHLLAECQRDLALPKRAGSSRSLAICAPMVALSRAPVAMGAGVRRDDKAYRRSTAIVRLAKVSRSAMTETK